MQVQNNFNETFFYIILIINYYLLFTFSEIFALDACCKEILC